MNSYAKIFCALSAAVAAGFWLGINYMGKLIHPIALDGEVPPWVSQAEWMAWASIAIVAVAAIGWMVLDYLDQQA